MCPRFPDCPNWEWRRGEEEERRDRWAKRDRMHRWAIRGKGRLRLKSVFSPLVHCGLGWGGEEEWKGRQRKEMKGKGWEGEQRRGGEGVGVVIPGPWNGYFYLLLPARGYFGVIYRHLKLFLLCVCFVYVFVNVRGCLLMPLPDLFPTLALSLPWRLAHAARPSPSPYTFLSPPFVYLSDLCSLRPLPRSPFASDLVLFSGALFPSFFACLSRCVAFNFFPIPLLWPSRGARHLICRGFIVCWHAYVHVNTHTRYTVAHAPTSRWFYTLYR